MIRIAKITQIQYAGRPLVQFQDPSYNQPENGILILPTGDNAFPSIGDNCYVMRVGDEYGLNFVFSYDDINAPKIIEGEKIVYGKKKNQVYLKQDGSIDIATADGKALNINAEGKVVITAPSVDVSGNVDVTGVYKVNGIQVVSNRQPAIPNPSAGLPELHAAVDAILIALRNHGLIAT